MQPDRVLGVDRLDERQDFRNGIEALKVAETCFRRIALSRNDQFWIIAAAQLGKLAHLVGLRMNARSQPFEHRFLS